MVNTDIPEWVQFLDNVAGKIFFAGFILNRMKDIPLGFVSSILSGIAMISFIIAYGLQIITSSYYDASHSFLLNYQVLFQLQAICGFIASSMIFIYPTLWLPGLWLFVLCNFLWFRAECFRLEQNTVYPNMPAHPRHYTEYALWSCIAISCSAILGTLAVCLPSFFIACMTIGLALNYIATIISFVHLYLEDSSPENQFKMA